MSKYGDLVAPTTTTPPVATPIPGREADMVVNNAGAYTFSVSHEQRLLRFLVLGAEGATYYADGKDHFRQAYTGTLAAVLALGTRAVEVVVDVSVNGRAPKQDATVFALALCAAKGDAQTRAAAIEAIPKVCRIPTHLFSFLSDYKALGGKTGGRAMKRALGRWYLDKDPNSVAHAMVKYRQRGGWTHADVLRLAKPAAGDTPHGHLFSWAVGKGLPAAASGRHIDTVRAFENVQDPNTSLDDLVNLVSGFDLPREAVPDTRLTPSVWKALFYSGGGMPMTAMVRNLNRMTVAGLLTKYSAESTLVRAKLRDRDALRKARVHPVALLSAARTYGKGSGERGSLTWTPNVDVVSALEDAFLLAFDSVTPTGLRYYVGLDVSGSMGSGEIAGIPGLTPREASAALALLWSRTEPSCIVKGFTASGGDYWNRATSLTDLTDRFATGGLRDVTSRVNGLDFGATQPALVVEDALRNNIVVDVFVILTDNEVNSGQHPKTALEEYRRRVNPNAKMVVIGMTATEFTLADPTDAGMLDVVGFDAAAPTVIADFATGGVAR